MRIAVAGGTGLVGRLVVGALSRRSHDVVVLARSRGIDLETGEGLEAALDGVQAVIDTTNVPTLSRARSVHFFEGVTRTLLDAESRAGVSHHLVLSIVGIDRIDMGYYEGKRRQEALTLAGPVPMTVLRTTQFHEFAEQTLQARPGPLAFVPRMRIQPVAASEVATALAHLAEGPATGMAPELAGPDVHELTDLARRVCKARNLRRLVVPIRLPGAAGRAMASGACLPTTQGQRGATTFDSWLGG